MEANSLIFSDQCYDSNSDGIQISKCNMFTMDMLKISSTNLGDIVYPIDIYLNLEQTEKLIMSLTSWVQEVRGTYEKIKA